MRVIPVVDLHCDLLASVEAMEGIWTFDSPETNCSLPQLKAGGVRIQTLAIFALTKKGSTASMERQFSLYQKLLRENRDRSLGFKEYKSTSKKIHFLLAIENSSALFEEDEPLEIGFARLQKILEVEKILYISLTWNGENRFGGGCGSTKGLKEDGKEWLKFLNGKGIYIDLSHASDVLAFDIVDFIDKESLSLTLIVSHSNFRKVLDVPRNLPDVLAQEIIRSGGVIGMNFVRHFIGEKEEAFLRHIEHGISLGGENSICLGADFFGEFDMPDDFKSHFPLPMFQEKYANSSCYQDFFTFLKAKISDDQIEKIAYKNGCRILMGEKVCV